MILRRADVADAATLAALSIEVWLATYQRDGISAGFAEYVLNTFTAANMIQLIGSPNEIIFVSQNRDGIDGYIRVTANAPCPTDPAISTEIATLYVQSRHHGKGRGQALLEKACDYCRTEGIPSLWLSTNAENTPAIGFYLAQGFIQTGQTDFIHGGRAYPNNVYVRTL